MKGFFSGFVQKRIKPISSGTVKNEKNTGGKNRFGKKLPTLHDRLNLHFACRCNCGEIDSSIFKNWIYLTFDHSPLNL